MAHTVAQHMDMLKEFGVSDAGLQSLHADVVKGLAAAQLRENGLAPNSYGISNNTTNQIQCVGLVVQNKSLSI